jgi:hypothetical protein
MTRCRHTFEILRDTAGNPSLIECPACGAWWNVEPNPQHLVTGPCANCGAVCDPGESLCVECLADETGEAQDASPKGATVAGRGEGAASGALAPSLPIVKAGGGDA